MRWLAFAPALALLFGACHDADDAQVLDAGGGVEFVAAEADFAPFRSWVSFQLPDQDPLSDLVYPAGSRIGFLSQRPPQGATSYPEGTLIVKAVQRGAGPKDWEIFALAKRGGDYNSAGALGWEFFYLYIDANDAVHIASRGIAPDSDGHGDMSPPPIAGTGYIENGQFVPCNLCHGQARNVATDHILSAALAPAATAQ